MTDDRIFTDCSHTGSYAASLTPRGYSFAGNDLHLIAMPPGQVLLKEFNSPPVLNVLPYSSAVPSYYRVNARDVIDESPARPCAIYFDGGEIELDCINRHWELLLELTPRAVLRMDHERLDGRMPSFRDFTAWIAPETLHLGHLAIDHLRAERKDRLYLEGISLALLGSTAERARTGFNIRRVSNRGTDARIRTAIEFIESDLAHDHSITELAAIAAMSPSWFARAFKAQTGYPVHGYVRERRLMLAQRLLLSGEDTLQQIAFTCGFADASHFTRSFKKRFGQTPKWFRTEFS